MVKAGKTLRNLLYGGALALATTFMSGCEPEPDPEVKDTTPPKISMYSPINGMEYDTKTIPLEYVIEENNFSNAWYSIDNGTKRALSQSGKQNLSLENGQHKIVLGASDVYSNSSKDSVSFLINEPVEIKDTTPPKISILSPKQDSTYASNDITFSWNIEEENFKEANYSVDNGAKTTLEGKSGTKTINLANGNHKIVLGASDTYSNSSKDSVSFSANKPAWKYEVNPFVSTNTNGAAYDNLETRVQGDNFVQEKLNEDWVSEIASSKNPLWDCTEFSKQLDINFYGFKGLTGYSGDKIDSIYFYHETLKDNGKYGLPIYNVTITGGIKHEMNAILTGNDATKFEDWNFIEPQFDQINVQPGQAYMPMNGEITINYTYVNKTDNSLDKFPIFKFKIEDGTTSFIWKSDNPDLNIITQRGK